VRTGGGARRAEVVWYAQGACIRSRKLMPTGDDERPGDGTTIAAGRIPAAREAAFRLVSTRGPDAGSEHVVDTAPGTALVGTGPGCDLRLTDSTVSRRHLECEIVEGGLRIRDLGSRNGTFVSGVSIVEAVVFGGETVHVGTSALRIERVAGAGALRALDRFGLLLGSSTAMRRLYPLLERLAASDVSVIIEGETGTGKEVLAESLHQMGARASGPFVVFDCTAVPPNLMEAELFGHERGAFTGAVTARRGLFEQAHGGTLLIDEIGDLDIHLQPKLLRVIERREVRRIGGTETINADVRVLAATRRDLDRAVAQGTFRDDLFHRLAVARVELPPLRKRGDDVALLAQRFWTDLGGEGSLPAPFVLRAQAHTWPGNVRELRNAVARELALGDLHAALSAEGDQGDAPGERAGTADMFGRVLALELPMTRARELVSEEFERAYVRHTLARAGGNVTLAAKYAGVAKRYFQLVRSRGKP
jgi:DNA-binding NtrC family response regulator